MHDSSPWLKTKRVNMTGLVLAWKKTCDVRETNPTGPAFVMTTSFHHKHPFIVHHRHAIGRDWVIQTDFPLPFSFQVR